MPVDLENVRTRAERLALENAVRHGGTPRAESVLGALLGSDAELRGSREEVRAVVAQVISGLAAMDPGAQKARLDALGGPVARPETRKEAETRHQADHGLPPLPGAEPGKVVLRMAPFPSGSLHVGHIRGIFIHDEYRRRYDGKFLLVFDDTVGSEEKRPLAESYDLILADFASVGIRPDAVVYKSDRMELYYRDVPRLLESGAAYVCTCPADQLRAFRERGIACPERTAPAPSHLEGWSRMLGGSYGPGEAVVRLRTDMAYPDPAFRDRVLFRISDFDHPRVGRKYRVWPMLEYAFALDDVALGITHVIRGKDLVIEDMMETALWKALGLHGPTFLHWGLLRIREAKLSKSKAYQEVRSGTYDGWSDPRTWSLSSFLRRGILPQAIRDFVLSFGLSQADIEVPAEALYAENRRLLDATTPRRAFVPDAVEVRVDGAPAAHAVDLANHPDRAELGRRTVTVDRAFYLPRADLDRHRGQEVRLKDLMNIELPPGVPATGPITARFTSLPNRPLPRLQWVTREGAVPVSVLRVDGSRTEGMGEAALGSSAPGDMFQFERFGFVRADTRPPTTAGGPRRFVFGHP